MQNQHELQKEREYVALVQQVLYEVINQAEGSVSLQNEMVRDMLTRAWAELRLKPTALSPQELQQLSTEIDRYQTRANFSKERMVQSEEMLLQPFFARIDFLPDGNGEELQKVVIGLYSLSGPNGDLLVHDWRAPISGLYYDALPGPTSYLCPDGEIKGILTLKRQYRFENGKLTYFVDTDVSIEDNMLMDLLSASSSRHMQQIVSTIQREQNLAVRSEVVGVLSVSGGAGSGKTSVAMHRIAYLMYRFRDSMNSKRIVVLSPSDAFSKYISTILPSLGEENVQPQSMHHIVRQVLGRKCESPFEQVERLLTKPIELRKQSIVYKSSHQFIEFLDTFIRNFTEQGPEMEELAHEKRVLATKEELTKLYRKEYNTLTPALRLMRIQKLMEDRMNDWAMAMKKPYERALAGQYQGKQLQRATQMAYTHKLHPLKNQVNVLLRLRPVDLYALCMRAASQPLAQAAQENADANLIWWEDAPAIAYLWIRLGFHSPNNSIRHILLDEVQDYSPIALKLLKALYPHTQATLLGDPNQCTTPYMPPAEPQSWAVPFEPYPTEHVALQRCYRSTKQIAQLCNKILGKQAAIPFGRDGSMPVCDAFSSDKLAKTVAAWREQGLSVAVATRTQTRAKQLLKSIRKSELLEVGDSLSDAPAETVWISGYHLLKGLEFDGLIIVWDDVGLDDSERRRLYTACSRALHKLCILAPQPLLDKINA